MEERQMKGSDGEAVAKGYERGEGGVRIRRDVREGVGRDVREMGVRRDGRGM